MQNRSVIAKIAMIGVLSFVSLFVFITSAGSFTRTSVGANAEVYSGKCGGCHGQDGKGSARLKERGVPDFTDAAWQKKNSDADIKAAIENGKGRIMPAWKGKIADEDMPELIAKIRSFGPK
jgi:mono/diheme cytochrome c family protein